MRDFLTDPAWQAEDIGIPIPDSPHACSVCLPTYDSVIGYEEGRDKVIRAMKAGYPRFFLNPALQALLTKARKDFCAEDEDLLLFPNKEVAQRAQRFIERRHTGAARVQEFDDGIRAVVVPKEFHATLLQYWRFTGEVVSSRQVEAVLEHRAPQYGSPHEFLKKLAKEFSVGVSDLYVYESGMTAIYTIYRAMVSREPGKKTLQVGFPYTDALKIQEHFGPGVVFLPDATGESFQEALQRTRQGEFAAVFCEIPSNPLLKTLPLKELSLACQQSKTPLIADETVSSHYNVSLLPHVDAVTTSLTKWISGKGDVMAGSVRLNSDSTFAEEMRAFLTEDSPEHCRLYGADRVVLEANMEGFTSRMKAVNQNAESVADFLSSHPAVEQVWYPKFTDREYYDDVLTAHGGYGGLLSFTIKNPKKTGKVFDLLAWNKGPSLGTDFSLASLYTLLAHYDEIDWAEGCGVSRHLIRLSVGLEDPALLCSSLQEALDYA